MHLFRRGAFWLLLLGAVFLRAQSLDPNFKPAADSYVYALVPQAGGRVVVAGAFTQLAGSSRNYLGRLNADGSLDASFTAAVDGVVRTMQLQPDGKLLIAGQFTLVNGQARIRVARLNADGSLDASFNPGAGPNSGEVRALVLQPDGRVVIGGGFDRVNGETHEGIARLNADGSVDASFNVRATGLLTPSAAPGVFTIARQDDGSLVFGGQFVLVNGQTRNGLARVRSDGTLDATFAPSATPASFDAVVVQPDGRLLVGGGFVRLGGGTQANLARLNADGTADASFAPGVNGGVATIFLEADGRIAVSGFFSVVGGQPRVAFARLLPWGAVDPAFRLDLTAVNPLVVSPIAAFVPLADGRVLVSGNFNSIGGTARANLALLTAPAPSRLVNLAVRGFIAPSGSLSMGFVARGGAKSLLVRGIGPTLATFGVAGALADPQLEIFRPGVAQPDILNRDWNSDLATRTAFTVAGAFPLPDFSRDAATFVTLSDSFPLMTARVTSEIAGGSGIALVETYDRNTPEAGRLVNFSTLGFAGTGAQALAPGFVIGGEASKRVLIRAVGPGLSAFGVGGLLADPQIAVIPQGQAASLASNDNWGGDATLAAAFTAVGAFGLPANSRDAAVLVRLPPGAYTAVVSGVANTTGTVLVEIYELEP